MRTLLILSSVVVLMVEPILIWKPLWIVHFYQLKELPVEYRLILNFIRWLFIIILPLALLGMWMMESELKNGHNVSREEMNA